MRRWLRILLVSLILLVIAAGAAWLVMKPRDSMFHGRWESEWIKSIQYNGTDEQTRQWLALGPDGARLLGRALDRGRQYRKVYHWLMPRLPGPFARLLSQHLSDPATNHSTRMCVVSLLGSLGKDAKPAEPAIGRALDDDDVGVRMGALGCYESGLLEVIGQQQKDARLPAFLRATRDREWGIENNAIVALQFYTNQSAIVVPVLVACLQNSNNHVRLMAAAVLAKMDPQTGIKAGMIPVLVAILKNPDNQLAYRAADALGELGRNGAQAVPDLVEAIHGTDQLVTGTARRALQRIDPEAAKSGADKRL